MPDSTTGQSPQDAFISSNGPDQWSPDNNGNIIQNATGLEWNGIPNQHVVPVPSHVNQSYDNRVNEHELIRFNAPPNYINIQYPRHVTQNFPVGIPNGQSMPPAPVIVRPPHRSTLPQSWASQQNLKLIQTAWNKTNSGGGVKKQKRVRTAFTSQQMMELEQEYARTRYLDRTRRIELSELLKLNERTIKIWFQNRRMKEKKDRSENAEETEDVSTTQSSAELGVMDQDQYQPNGEGFNRMGVYIEQYPVSTTSMAPMPQVQMMAPGYSTYAVPVGPPQYQHVHLQVQYPNYSEVQELSPDSVPQSESSVSIENTQSDTSDKSWDMAWIRGIKAEDEC